MDMTRLRSASRLTAGLTLALGGCLGHAGQFPQDQATNVRATHEEVRELVAPEITVVVDHRIELLAIIFRLAGAREFSGHSLPEYAAAIDTFFAPHRGHPIVASVQRLREERGIYHDAVMSLAIHLGDFPWLEERIPFEESTLDSRWTATEARAFAEEVRAFAKEVDAGRFFLEQEGMYEAAVRRMTVLLDRHIDEAWFQGFFGPLPGSRFILSIAPGNGTTAYGPRFQAADGSQEMYAIMGVWQRDELGLPAFGDNLVATIVHEFSHSFVNPVVERSMTALEDSADAIFSAVAPSMRQLGYSQPHTMISESLVRAAVARYMLSREGVESAQEELDRQKVLGFLWIEDLFTMLGAYERSRDRYPDLESFFPQVAAYFEDLAPRMTFILQRRDERRPNVIAMTPPNRSIEVDPRTDVLTFQFDRPMRNDSYSVMRVSNDGSEHYPEVHGVEFDPTGLVFTMHVELQPTLTYVFALNSESVKGFVSRDGVPLDPLEITFATGTGEHEHQGDSAP